MSRSISFLTSHVNRALLATLALAAFTLASPLQAQTYPTKPIKAIVPFAPGSATDQIGRAFAAKNVRTTRSTHRGGEQTGCERHAGGRRRGQVAR